MQKNRLYYGKGLGQSEYLKNKAVLQDFHVIENDWIKLFQWAMSIGNDIAFFNNKNEIVANKGITSLWHNQIFSILIEIAQTNVESYKNTYIRDEDFVHEKIYNDDLKCKIEAWIERINLFFSTKLQNGGLDNENLSIKVAQTIKKQLELSIQPLDVHQQINTQYYYNMLSTINEIGERCDFYIKQIEASEDMEPSLALFVTFIRNYCSIVERLNKMVTTLPEFYNNSIIKGRSRITIQDTTELIITQVESAKNSFIIKETPFIAGKNSDGTDLLYRAISQTRISDLALSGAYSIYVERDENNSVTSLQKKTIDYSNPQIISPLFISADKSCHIAYGWVLESHMLDLEEGEREVTISMKLTDKSVLSLNKYKLDDDKLDGAFSILYSNEEGWSESTPTTKYNDLKKELSICFKLQQEDPPTALCEQAIHNYTTNYPTVQILLKNGDNYAYNWAILTQFTAIKITTKVSDIHKIDLFNETGLLDPTAPFFPFGAQGNQGSWFIIGSQEMAMKPLTDVTFRSEWNQLPYEGGFSEIYKDYSINPTITNSSFLVNTSVKEGTTWQSNDEKAQELFKEDEAGAIDNNCVINFAMSKKGDILPRENHKNTQGFLRVTLTSPSIGFGTEKYKQLFSEIMVNNSNSKSKNQKKLPLSPILPTMSNAILSYVAKQSFKLSKMRDESKTVLRRINSLYDIKKETEESYDSQYLAETIEFDFNLVLKLKNSIDESSFCIYFDMLSDESSVNENYDYAPKGASFLSCRYLDGDKWESVELEDKTNGLTKSGYINFTFPKQISEKLLDENGDLSIHININGDITSCLAIRNIYTNCITVKADGGDGASLPANTIKQSWEELDWVKKIEQPFDGTKGKISEDDEHLSARLSYRCANRCRAINPSDYEQMVLERFSDIEKVYCIPNGEKGKSARIYIIVFSREQNELIPITPIWLLTAIKEHLTQYTSPWVEVEVINPSYEKLKIECEFSANKSCKIDAIKFRMKNRINDYFAYWMKNKKMPGINQRFSHKELYAKLANDEGITKLNRLMVNEEEIKHINFDENDNYIRGKHIWSIFIPDENHVFVCVNWKDYSDGIDADTLEEDFVIG